MARLRGLTALGGLPAPAQGCRLPCGATRKPGNLFWPWLRRHINDVADKTGGFRVRSHGTSVHRNRTLRTIDHKPAIRRHF